MPSGLCFFRHEKSTLHSFVQFICSTTCGRFKTRRVHSSIISILCNRIVAKNPKVPLFLFLAFIFFHLLQKFSMSPKGSRFHTLEQTGVSKSPTGPPFTLLKTSRFLSLRYSADFGHSRLVFPLSDIMDLRHQSSATCIIVLGGEDTHLWSATKIGNPIPTTIPVDH